jgi:hypothetical protein
MGARKFTPLPYQIAGEIAVRFWSRVDRRGPDECWLWRGCTNDKGYGHIRIGGRAGRAIGTHQLAYLITHGTLPAMVLHTCDVRNCCNPAHLFAGNGKVNADDRERKGRGNHAKGERCASARLTEHAVREIRRLHALGASLATVAKALGVSYGAVHSAATGETWRHIGKEG